MSIPNLKQYVTSQIKKVSAMPTDPTLKGSNIQVSKAHKAGYLEAMENLKTLLTGM